MCAISRLTYPESAMTESRLRAHRKCTHAGPGHRHASYGFTYLGLLFTVALIGVALGLIGEVWHTVERRQAERELRFVGNEFSRAIGRYYESTPGPVKMFPRTLNDLLKDDRHPDIRRHLRRIYRDPITLKQEWGLIAAPTGGIAGVHSQSIDEPLSQPPAGGFETRPRHPPARYVDWIFVYVPPNTNTAKASPIKVLD